VDAKRLGRRLHLVDDRRALPERQARRVPSKAPISDQRGEHHDLVVGHRVLGPDAR
jgi:hypothetical protein